MASIPRISDTEWEVMQVIWAHAPLTSAQINEHLLAQDPTWHPKTVGTLLGRLVRKQALGYRKEGRMFVYRPLVTQKEAVSAVSKSFLERVFGGTLAPMLAHFVQERKLSSSELKELRRLLDHSK